MADDTAPSEDPEDDSAETPDPDTVEDDSVEEPSDEESASAEAPDVFTTPRLESIRTPIPGGAPGGIDMKYEDDFQTLKAEVDLLGAATGDVDFDKIVDLSTQILSEKSKDISVASYLILGLTRTAKYEGIAEGLAAVRSVTESFWEDAFPPLRRMRGRQAALQFVAERTSAWIQDNKAEPGDRESLTHAQAEAEALQAFVTESMGEDAPAFSGLVRELREQLRRLPKPKPPKEDPPPAKEPDASSTADPAPSSASAPAAPSPASGGDASFSTPSEAERVVMKVATFLQEEDPYNATAFAIRRAVRWNGLTTPPPPGVIPPPPGHRRDALAGMVTAGNHPLLVSQGEGTFPQAPFHFWLDLQRLLATSLKTLGPPAAAALSVVESTTAALVTRFPSLPSLTFQDGTPFADPMTMSWLEELTASDGGGAGGSEMSAESEAAIKEARDQAAGGDVPGAVAALMANAGAPRDRFERTVIAAELCLGAGRADVALGLLETADDAIRTHQLDVWDPGTASKALRLIHTCCSQLVPTAGSPDRASALNERASDAFNRLSRLDPAHAMRSTPAPKR